MTLPQLFQSSLGVPELFEGGLKLNGDANQKCLAKSQCLKRCSSVSSPAQHLSQIGGHSIPLRLRFFIVGRDLCISLHRKFSVLGEALIFQICFQDHYAEDLHASLDVSNEDGFTM
nr:uncharacterized protein LOC112696813 isoform X1 [Arachis hypogaea]